MNNFFSMPILFLLTIALLCSCIPSEQGITSSELASTTANSTTAISSTNTHIIILHTNDVHAGVNKNIGYAGLLAYKNELESLYGEENVLLVDCGDSIQGENIAMLTQGRAMIELMNAIEYDYIILGNHEFDYGMEQLLELSAEVEAHIVATNFVRLEDNKPVFAPYEIYTVDDTSIAFIGVTTPETISKAGSQHFKDEAGHFLYTLGEDASGQRLYDMVQESVDMARAEGADFVIALAHLGLEDAAQPWRSTDLIAHTTGIDIVLDGHSHSVMEGAVFQNSSGNDVIMSQAGSKLKYIGQVTIDIDKKEHVITAKLVDEKGITWPKESTMQARIDAMNEEFAEMLVQKVAYSAYDLVAYTETEHTIRKEETNLGDLVADAYRTLLGTDIAISNAGGIRTNLHKGDITFQNIIDIHPFGNYIMSMEVTGLDIKNALEMGAKRLPQADEGFVHVSGITYSIDTSIPSSVEVDDYGNFVGVNGAYRVQDILINGEMLDEKRRYSLASHDYLLKRGGDGLTMFKNCPVLLDMVMLDSDVLIAYIKEHLRGEISEKYANPKGDQRIRIF